MQLGKPHFIRIFDYQRVCVRNIDSRFDYRRADENIDIAGDHPLPYGGELFFFHLPVCHFDHGVRKFLAQFHRLLNDRVNSVVQIKDLPAAAQLSAYCLVYYDVVVFQNVGLDGESVSGRFVQN